MKKIEQRGEFAGLRVRTSKALSRGGYATRKDVQNAVRAGRLQPHLSIRDYGRFAHQEVILWLNKGKDGIGLISRVAPRIWDAIRAVLLTDAAVARWLMTANKNLDGQTPYDALANKSGASKVLSLARASGRGPQNQRKKFLQLAGSIPDLEYNAPQTYLGFTRLVLDGADAHLKELSSALEAEIDRLIRCRNLLRRLDKDLLRIAKRKFDSELEFARWLMTPNTSLHGRIPMTLLVARSDRLLVAGILKGE